MAKLSNGPEDKRILLDTISEKIDRWIETPEAVISIDVSVEVEMVDMTGWTDTVKKLGPASEVYTIVIRTSVTDANKLDAPNQLVDTPEAAKQVTMEMLKDAYKKLMYGGPGPSPSSPLNPPPITGQHHDKTILDDLVEGGLITQEKRDKLWESIIHKMDIAKGG